MLPLSTILIFEFEIVPIVWYFVLCSFYSYYDFCWYIFLYTEIVPDATLSIG